MSASTTSTDPVKVVFVAGTGRSGTTIISNVLGQLPGCFAAGEVRYAWTRGMAHDHLCGCGRPFGECPLWTSVVREAFGDEAPDAEGVGERIDERLRVRMVPAMVLRRLTGRPAVAPHPDDELIVRLYRALASRSGGTHLVDSSKLPPYAALLSSLPGIEMFVVHVVRDPRATAFSWRRQKSTRDSNDASTMPRLENWRSAVLWQLWNTVTERWFPAERRLLVRYEDFVSQPEAVLRLVASHIGVTMPSSVIENGYVNLSPTHSVAGNPSRLDNGRVALRADIEWQRAMPRAQRLLVTALTVGGLRRFGYRLGNDSAEQGVAVPAAR